MNITPPPGVELLADFSKVIAPALERFVESKGITAPKELIKRIMPQGGLGMIWGAPGSYKSFVALDWALAIASGIGTWLGRKAKKGQVWYLAGEGHSGLDRRVKAWKQAHNFNGKFDLLVSPRALILDSDDGFSDDLIQLVNMIEQGNSPCFIVIDTLSRSMAGDENSSKDSARYIAAIDYLFSALRRNNAYTTVLIVHHSRKDNDIYRGSTVFRGAIDFEYEMVKTGPLRATLEHRKSKDGEIYDPINFEFFVENIGSVEDDFGEVSEVTSLSVWIENKKAIKHEVSPMHTKAMEVWPAIQLILANRPQGITKRGIEEELRAIGLTIRKSSILEILDILQQEKKISVDGGDKRSHVIFAGSVVPEDFRQSVQGAQTDSNPGF